jgi:hypothetical protein
MPTQLDEAAHQGAQVGGLEDFPAEAGIAEGTAGREALDGRASRVGGRRPVARTAMRVDRRRIGGSLGEVGGVLDLLT